MFPFIAAFIESSMEEGKSAPMIRFDTRYCEVFADVTGDIRQWTWSKKELESLERIVTVLKGMSVEKFN